MGYFNWSKGILMISNDELQCIHQQIIKLGAEKFFRFNDFEKLYSSVPVELISKAFEGKTFNELHLFLSLKLITNGRFPEHNITIQLLKKIIGVKDVRTLKCSLNKLYKAKFLGHDNKTNIYFIRSYKYLKRTLNLSAKTSVTLTMDDLSNREQFRAWCAATKIYYRIKWMQRWRILAGNKRKHKYSSVPLQAKNLSSFNYKGISASYMANLIQLSKVSGYRYKLLAKKYGYIKIIPKISDAPFTPKELTFFRQQGLRESLEKYTIVDDKVIEKLTDEIVLTGKIKLKTKHL